MEKINLQNLDFDIYKEVLPNGLKVYMAPYKNKKNYFITFATKYGSDVLEYIDEYEIKQKPPLGIAHFLEHKMFEQENGIDPFTYYSKSGTDSNASTSYNNTQYLCSGTKNFKNNLRYLINFVTHPYFTNENVEKEKGIIAEEINMYKDMPDFQLEMKLRECIYKKHSRRIDIAGSVEEINKITKEDLYNVYNNFYTPNNMFVLIVGNFNKEEALNTIQDEIEHIGQKRLPKIIFPEEPEEVYKKKAVLKGNVNVPKIALGLKVPTTKLGMNRIELDMYLNMLTTILFGSSSEFRERTRNEKILTDIYTEWETIKGFKTFYIMSVTKNPDQLLKEIISEFENMKINEQTFERIKKVWIAGEAKMIDNADSTAANLFDDILQFKDIVPNKVELIREMKLSKLLSLIKKIDFNNYSIVKMISNSSDEENI